MSVQFRFWQQMNTAGNLTILSVVPRSDLEKLITVCFNIIQLTNGLIRSLKISFLILLIETGGRLQMVPYHDRGYHFIWTLISKHLPKVLIFG